MVWQVLESGRLRVNKRNVEVLVGAAGPGARRINAEIARGAYYFTFRGETIRATTVVVKYPGCQVESQGSTRAGAQMRVTTTIKAQARHSLGLWALRSIGLANKIRLWQALVRSVLMYAAEAHARQPRDVETQENWQIEQYDTLQDPLFMCVSRAHARPSKEAWSTHSSVNAASSEVTLGKEWLREENISRG